MSKINIKKYQDFKFNNNHYMVSIYQDGILIYNDSVDTLDQLKDIASHFNVALPEGL